MDVTHALAAGMGGIRTAGDLVARMQMSRGMRLEEAKEYVAGRLGCTVRDLSDSYAMEQIRALQQSGEIGVMTYVRLLMPAHAASPKIETWLVVMAAALVPATAIIFVPEALQRPLAITAAVLLAVGSCILMISRRHHTH